MIRKFVLELEKQLGFNFQTSEYCQRLSRDLSTENQRKNDLKIREKQLTSQIEKLVSESIGCLKNRLDELGIEVLFLIFKL